jgi:hypothetical protein
LKELTIPANVIVIGPKAFACCRELTQLLFENEALLQRIEESAFYGTAIRSISIPKGVVSVGDLAFGNCTALSVVAFAKEAEVEIGREAFGLAAVRFVVLPCRVRKIGRGAFPAECRVALEDGPKRKKLVEWHRLHCHKPEAQLAFEGRGEEEESD